MTRPAVKSLERRSWRFRRARRGQAYSHGFSFTLTGVGYVLISLLVGLAAANNQINLLFLFFGILLGGLLISGIVSTLDLSSLRAVRKVPPAVMAGQLVMLVYQVFNRKRHLASYSLHVREYQSPASCGQAYLPIIRRKDSLSQPALLHLPHRGLYHFQALSIYTRFPFSLFVHFARFRCDDWVVAYPRLGRLTSQALAAVGGGPGAQVMPRSGGHEEFYGLREYRQGDNPRWIHWRRSARVGALVMREMSPLSPQQLVVIISLVQPAGQGDQAAASRAPTDDDRLELGMSLAATLIDDAGRRGLAVGLLVADGRCDRELRWHPPVQGRRSWLAMMRTLAVLAPAAGDDVGRPDPRMLRQLASSRCLWITHGLSEGQVAGRVAELAAWNVSVHAVRAEDGQLDRLLVMPPQFVQSASAVSR